MAQLDSSPKRGMAPCGHLMPNRQIFAERRLDRWRNPANASALPDSALGGGLDGAFRADRHGLVGSNRTKCRRTRILADFEVRDAG